MNVDINWQFHYLGRQTQWEFVRTCYVGISVDVVLVDSTIPTDCSVHQSWGGRAYQCRAAVGCLVGLVKFPLLFLLGSGSPLKQVTTCNQGFIKLTILGGV